jgi:polar amino acid transport system substrate-binding protein
MGKLVTRHSFLPSIFLPVLLAVVLMLASAVGVHAESDDPAHILTITVGADRDYPPYEFLDKNGEPVGYNVDLTRAIAEVMGMRVKFVFGGWSEMRAALMDGSVDVMQGIPCSEERSSALAFSPPHTIINHAIFARRETPPVSSFGELRGKEVLVFEDGIMHDTLRGLGFRRELYLNDAPAGVRCLLASVTSPRESRQLSLCPLCLANDQYNDVSLFVSIS